MVCLLPDTGRVLGRGDHLGARVVVAGGGEEGAVLRGEQEHLEKVPVTPVKYWKHFSC